MPGMRMTQIRSNRSLRPSSVCTAARSELSAARRRVTQRPTRAAMIHTPRTACKTFEDQSEVHGPTRRLLLRLFDALDRMTTSLILARILPSISAAMAGWP